MTAHLIVCKGLPGSGKTTFARDLVANNLKYRRINRDALREMADGGRWSKAREKTIKAAELALARLFVDAGYHVVVDDTNLSESAMRMWADFAAETGARLEVKDFTDVDVEECIRRDQQRPHYVGEKVIRKMYRDHLAPKPPEPPAYDLALPDCVIADLDGTVCLHNGRNPYDGSRCEEDLPNEAVLTVLTSSDGYADTVLFVSGRQETWREPTERWLRRYLTISQPWSLYMRAAGDARPDSVVKREIYEQEIRGKWNVHFVMDDRDQVIRLWRAELGLPTFQVAYGDF